MGIRPDQNISRQVILCSKDYGNYIMLDVKKDIITLLRGKEDPCTVQGILRGLNFGTGDKQYVKSILTELVREGRLIKTGSRFWVKDGKRQALVLKREKTRKKNEIVGKLSISSQGMGFVPAPGRDWLIPKGSLGGAHQGDIVRVVFTEMGRGNRMLGRVEAIIEFGVTTLLGVFEVGKWGRAFLPFNNAAIDHRNLGTFPPGIRDGMVGKWGRGDDGKWIFQEMLGMITDPVIDEAIALSENDVVSIFSEEVLEAAAQFPEDFEFEPGNRRDFREELVFTIDGPDARDFDDALHFKRLGHQMVEVGIHIADVSAFVPQGSKLDDWAAEQANSTYLPHKAFPMLPEILSTQLCSLKPGVPRYTLSVVACMNMSGKVESFEVCKGIIQSSYRLTYDQVATIAIDHSEKAREQFAEVTPALDLGMKLSRNMRKRRVKAGGLDMDLAEVNIKINENQELEKVSLGYQNDSNRMIEAFMVLANECIAARYEEYGLPFRIHEAPGNKRLEEFSAFLSTCGIEAPGFLLEKPGQALNVILGQLKDLPSAQVMQTQVLKTLKLAEYNPNNMGHFGLSSSHYAHFTSPIRRYADLYTHQRLTQILAKPELGPEHYDNRGLEEICAHISKKERASMRAEQTFRRIKLLRRILKEVGNDFSGIISDVKSYGLFITLDGWYVSGMISIEDLDDDNYEFFPDLLAIVGRYNGHSYKVGQAVQVKLVRADLISRKLDLAMIKGSETVTAPIAKPRGRPLNKRKTLNRFLKKNKGNRRGRK